MFQDTRQLSISIPKYPKVPWKSWWFISTIFDKQFNLDAISKSNFLVQVSLHDLLVHKQLKLTTEFLPWEKNTSVMFNSWSYHPPRCIIKCLYKGFCCHNGKRLLLGTLSILRFRQFLTMRKLYWVLLTFLKMKNLFINDLKQELNFT